MSQEMDSSYGLTEFREDFSSLRDALADVLVGNREVIDLTLAAMIAGGHVLLEGPPGVGKTVLARTLAELVDVDYRRIQFTSDLMPADIVGTYVVMETAGRRKFEFQQGPIFTNFLLADEINRATPKTQAALFEALEERALTVANETYSLPNPFFAIATQSLGDIEGTFPIPETQLDRFSIKLSMELPTGEELSEVLKRTTEDKPVSPRSLLDGKQILQMSDVAYSAAVAPEVRSAAADIVMATNPSSPLAPESTKQFVLRGASPRAGQAMILIAKVLALVEGRGHVSRDDLKRVAPAALRHRVVLNFEGHAQEAGVDGIISDILDSVKS